MKKSNFLKITFTLVMAFVITGAFAQIPADYTETQLTEATSYQTVSKNFTLYVLPDPIYSPTYTVDGTINADAEWTWNLGGLTGVAPWTDNAVAIANNYVEISSPAEGTYTVNAKEGNSATGCDDGTGIDLTVEVIKAPTAVIAGTVANVNYTWNGAGPYEACVPTTTGAEAISVTITEDADLPVNLRAYAFSVAEVVDNVTAADFTVTDGAVSNQTFDYDRSGKLSTATVGLPAGHTFTSVLANDYSTYSFATAALVVENNKPTRYTYTLAAASDGTTGIVSAISQKSDYGGAVIEHGFGATTVTYVVLPAPVTGPIYHIANDYAL
jgi:hypothetical protein